MSCNTGRLTKNDNINIKNHWINLHEENTNSIKVFKTSDYKFKPSRGREEIIIKKNDILRYKPISSNDAHIFYDGTWKIKNSKLILHYNGKTKIFKILNVNNQTLKLK